MEPINRDKFEALRDVVDRDGWNGEDTVARLKAWFEENNPGGHDFNNPPPRKLIEEAFPEEDSERIDYLLRKPNRTFELF
jgi:hypothetical protein